VTATWPASADPLSVRQFGTATGTLRTHRGMAQAWSISRTSRALGNQWDGPMSSNDGLKHLGKLNKTAKIWSLSSHQVHRRKGWRISRDSATWRSWTSSLLLSPAPGLAHSAGTDEAEDAWSLLLECQWQACRRIPCFALRAFAGVSAKLWICTFVTDADLAVQLAQLKTVSTLYLSSFDSLSASGLGASRADAPT